MLKNKKKVFIVAEIGNNHEGEFKLAKEMISLAASAGADAVKFQTFIPEYYVSNSDLDRIKRLKSFQLSQNEFKLLSEFAKECGVEFFSTPFDLDSAMFLNQIQSIFKISSGDNTFYPLIDKISSFGKPIIVSTGMTNTELIDNLYKRILDYWYIKNHKCDLALLHCVSSYPVPDGQANLLKIKTMIEKYPLATIGYSDHTIGNEASIYAVSLGARIIEKHFTLNKNYSNFRDHQLSADPDDFSCLVESIRKIELLKGDGKLIVQKCEKEIEVRRSIAAKSNLNKGDKISLENITWVRPGIGLTPGKESQIIGKRLLRDINQGELFSIKDLGE